MQSVNDSMFSLWLTSSPVSLNRRVMKEDGFTFSNGVTLPKGTYVAASMHAAHMNSG